MGPKASIQDVTQRILTAMGEFETAANKASDPEVIPVAIYNPIYAELLRVQGKDAEGNPTPDGGWSAIVGTLFTLAASLPDDPPVS